MEVKKNHFKRQRQNLRLLSHALEYLERGMELLKQAKEREQKLMRNHDNNVSGEERRKMVNDMKNWGVGGV